MTTPQPEQPQETISLPLQRAFRGYSKESVQKVIQELTRRLAEAQQRPTRLDRASGEGKRSGR